MSTASLRPRISSSRCLQDNFEKNEIVEMTCSKAADVTHAAGATEFGQLGQSHRPTQVSSPLLVGGGNEEGRQN